MKYITSFFVLLFVFGFGSAVHASPSVTVTAPNGGQCYVPGTPVIINWSGMEYHHVAIAYRTEAEGQPPEWSSNASAWNIIHYPVTGTTYTWYPTTASVSIGTPYRIWIEGHTATHARTAIDSSDYSFGFATSCSSGSGTATSTDTTAPTAPTVSASALSSSSVSLSWSGSTDNVGVTGYTIYRNGTYLTTTTSLSYFDSGLMAGTTYSYTVSAYDASGNMSVQGSASVTTSASNSGSGTATTTTDTTAPVISNVRPENIMGSGAQIRWDTDDASDSRVFYGTTAGNLTMSSDYRCDTGGNVTTHCVNLMGLAYGTAYYYKVESRNATYLNAASAQYQFTSGFSSTTNASGTTTTTSGTSNITATTTQDMIPPAPPSAVSAYAVSSSSISISWSGAVDNVGVVGYKVFRSGTHRGTTTALSYTDAGLNPSTNYVYTVAAYDASGNISSLSTQAFATTMSVVTTTTSGGIITGKVADANGRGLAGVSVNAGNSMAGTFMQAKTGSDGKFSLAVASGDWMVSVYSEPALGYYYQQGHKTVSVSSGTTAETNFIMLVADAEIMGSVTNANEQVLTDAFGYISTYALATTNTASSMMPPAVPVFGGPIEKGNFKFRAVAGTYALTIYFAPDSKYSAPASRTVTIASGSSQSVNFAITQGGDATITGSLRDANGAAVTGIDASKMKLYVSSGGGAWRNAVVDAAAGTYSVQVGAGTWYLGAWTDPSSGYVAQESDREVTVASGERRTVDVSLTRADSVLSGVTKAADGSTLANVWVSVENRSFADMSAITASTSASPFVAGANSDNLGNFKITLPPGTYFIHAHYPPSYGYINPEEASVTIVQGKTVIVDLVFRKPDAKLAGMTTLDSKGVPAFVWAWSESGGSASTRSDTNGAYSLSITRRDRWHMASSFEYNGVFYKSADIIVEAADQVLAAQELVLLSVAPLVQAAERVVEVAKLQSVEVADGAKVIMPANALGTTGSANVTMKPTAEVPSFASSSVVGTGYEVEAKNETGTSITSLNSEITITIPYDEADLAAKGLTPENLALSFFDETTNVWRPLEKQVVDRYNKTISAVVSHLTLFALVAPADTAAPDAPTAITVSPAGNTVALAWKNPPADFHHVKIYRSLQAGVLGDVVFNYITAETKIDPSGTAAHYYVVRAVDLAGNESANTAQMKGSASGAAQANAVLPQTPSGVLLVRVEGDPRVYVVKEGKKQWIRSADEFVKSGYDWKAIVAVSAAQLAAYADAVAASSTVSFVFAQNLSFGARSETVRRLQEALAKDRAVYPQGTVSGYFGPATRAAVVRFQKKHNIAPASGFVGPKTRQKLNEL